MKFISPKRLLLLVSSIFIGLILLVSIFYVLLLNGVFGPVLSKSELADIQNATASVIYDRQGEPIGKIFAENRTNVRFEELPENLVQALIATEDARYFEHQGIDARSILRVLVKSILLGHRSAGGGSTISQQLAKNLFGRGNYGVLSLPVNKTREMILARRLEEVYSKEEILELYLNTVSFSENVYGIEAASLRFFNKKPAQLQVHESAVLVGLLKANTYYNPRLNPENALQRRNVVLSQMEQYAYITAGQRDSMMTLDLGLRYRNLQDDHVAAYYVDRVKEQVRIILEREGLSDLYDPKTDGLSIYTALDADLQQLAEESLSRHLTRLQAIFDRHWPGQKPWEDSPVMHQEIENSRSYQNLLRRKLSPDSVQYYLSEKHLVQVYKPGGDTLLHLSIRDSVAYYLRLLRGGFAAMSVEDGAVLCWTGGLDQRLMPYDHVLAKRQAASTFKPLVYATALEAGVDPCSYIANERLVYEEYGNWAPENYDRKYGGYYSMAGALKKSINVAAVQTLFEVGVNEVIRKARQTGVESELPAEPSLALGTGSISLFEMLQLYASFASGGLRVQPYFIARIEDQDGKLIYERPNAVGKRVWSQHTASLLSEMLKGVVSAGTGERLHSQFGVAAELAGKTGTAQNYSDAWFMAYNPKIVAGVWVGGTSPLVRFRSGTHGSGSAQALPVAGYFFNRLEENNSLRQKYLEEFPRLTPGQAAQLDCPDFREKNLFDGIIDIFRDREGEKYRDSSEEKKPGLFQRIFGRKKR